MAHPLLSSIHSILLQPLLDSIILPYILIFTLLFILMLPNRASWSTPRFNPILVSRAKHDDVDFKSKIEQDTPCTGNHYLIVGGAGFIGSRIIHTLLLRGEQHIVSFDISNNGHNKSSTSNNVKYIQGNVTNLQELITVCQQEKIDTVFSTFGVIRFMDNAPNQARISYNVNVIGVENLIQACIICGVKRLIHTSTSLVSLSKGKPCSLEMNEKTPFTIRENSPSHYIWTKAIGEQLITRANGIGSLQTIVLRPGYVFGANDKKILDGMLKIGRTILPPNGGRTVIDFIPILNCVYAHLLAERALISNSSSSSGSVDAAGETFCISNESPMRIIDFIGMVSVCRSNVGFTPVHAVPTPELLLRGLSRVIDLFEIVIGKYPHLFFMKETPLMISLLNTTTLNFLDMSWAFSSRKAKEMLGYSPLYTVEQGIQHAVCEWRNDGEFLP
jgi:nucleoside-diphosphate-sugar epimerase